MIHEAKLRAAGFVLDGDGAAGPTPALSVVAPCFNEDATLATFVERMTAACAQAGLPEFELVLVNDGSSDDTWNLIRSMSEADPRVVGVNLSRNHGHQIAVSAGLDLARGDRVLIIDSDLQDPPELLGEMMAAMNEGFDVVYGRRRTRADESRFKLATAKGFYRVLHALSDVEIPVDTGDFRLLTRRTVDRLNSMPERDRFVRGMVAWLGGRQTEVPYDRAPRLAGETGYTLRKMIKLAMDGLTSFSTAPLRLASVMAVVGVIAAAAVAAYAIGAFFMGRTTPGWTSLALITICSSTAQLTCLAVFGEYLGRSYMQGKGRPLYLIDEIVSTPRASLPLAAAGRPDVPMDKAAAA